MDQLSLQVRMLGEFSISQGDRKINDSDNRSRKVWLLLAYMIYCRQRTISQEELIALLWGDEERSSNPVNALKTMFHRVRTTLNQLDESAGHSLIIRRDGNYAWNPQVPFFFDVDEFETLCRRGAAAEDSDQRLACYLQALDLYQGDFLSKLSAEPWVVPISAYFHNLFVGAAQEALELLESKQRFDQAIAVCRSTLELEPYNEEIYQHLMRDLMETGDHREAASVYENMSQLLFSTFGILPSPETTAIYREATRTFNDRAISPLTLREQLREQGESRGALLCDYDFFTVIYQAEARAIARSGDAVHIGLLSVTGEKGDELPKRSLDRCMDNLRELVRMNLRKGDVAARCSVSQYIIMLPRANYENSCMVMDRIITTFCRQYPHSPARLQYAVLPMEPNI